MQPADGAEVLGYDYTAWNGQVIWHFSSWAAGSAAGFDFHNPGGPVSLNPQPLPPKVYLNSPVSRTIIWQ